MARAVRSDVPARRDVLTSFAPHTCVETLGRMLACVVRDDARGQQVRFFGVQDSKFFFNPLN